MLRNQSGFTALEGVLMAIVVIAIGAAGYFAFEGRSNKLAETKPASTESTQKSDPYAGWQTYTSKVNGVSFKYPADWKSAISTTPQTDNTVEEGKITSPDGFVFEFRNPADGVGGGCGDPCPYVTKTYAAEKSTSFSGKEVYIVKLHSYNSEDKSEYDVKRIGFSEKGGDDSYDPTKSTYQGPVPLLAAPLAGDSMFYLVGGYGETSQQSKLSIDQYFQLDDLKDAELVLKSLKVQ